MKTLICADGKLEVESFALCPKLSMDCKSASMEIMKWIVDFSEKEDDRERMLDQLDPENLLPCLLVAQELKFTQLEEYLSEQVTIALQRGSIACLNLEHDFTDAELSVMDASYSWVQPD